MSKTSTVMANLKSTIQGVNGAGIYTKSIANRQVTTKMQSFNKIPPDQLPHFAILYQSERPEHFPSHQDRILSFRIKCVFKNMDESDISEYIADVERALLVDVTRGGNAWETTIELIERDPDGFDMWVIHNIDVIVKINHPHGEP